MKSSATKTLQLASAKKYIFIALVIFLLLLPQPGLLIGFSGALGVLFFAARGELIRPARGNLALLVLAVGYALGFAFGPHNALALSSAGTFVAGVLLFFLILTRANQTQSFANAIAVLLGIGIGLALLAPFTVVEDISKSFAFPFMPAFAPRLPKEINSNVMSGALVAILPLALGALAQKISLRIRLLGALAIFPLAFVLFFLQSRSAWLAFAIAFAVMLVVWNKWFFPVVLVGVAGFFALAPRLNLPALDAPAGPYNIVGRIGTREQIWALAAQLIVQHPVIGIGAGAFESYSAANAKEVEPGIKQIALPHAHNWFLQVALDTGLPGIFAFLMLLFFTARSLWRARQSETLRPIFIALLGAWVAMLVHGITDATLWDTRASFVLWWLWGLSLVWDNA